MKRILILLFCLLLCTTASAQVLPDAGAVLDVSPQQQMADYVYSPDYVCNVWVYPRDARTDNRIADWIMAALHSGYTIRYTTVDGQTAYRLEDASGRYALMFPQYQGAVMLMIQQGMDYAPALATPTPKATAKPVDDPIITTSPNSDWVWVEVEKDCPYCIHGECGTCNGSGIYRLYGQSVGCPKDCAACDGKGTIIQKEYQQVFY
ncbi:MAG: hypothetical protein IJ392_06340 [Clostridia bacterium]|nr:hypothetical protein [Clostridia bacterium]